LIRGAVNLEEEAERSAEPPIDVRSGNPLGHPKEVLAAS
jgi:hypothetical protein